MKIKFSLVFFLCFAIFASVSLCFAQRTDNTGILELFVRANMAYKQAKYDEAISDYESILSKGYDNGNLYYNLGNSYFKKGLLGKAVLNYERARFFMPNDSDLRSNYEYVLSLTYLAHERSGGNWFVRGIDKLFSGVNCNFIACVLSACFCLVILIIILRMTFPQRRKFYKILLFLILIIFIPAMLAFNRKLDYFDKSAVIISKETEAKFGPLQDATTFFMLPEGSKVKILDQTFDWFKIRRFDGKEGWVAKSDAEKMF